ncbi:hypothetical protein I6N95_17720 [Vagococcus sp. BWB3-3]|uniref:Uncharacterized protein n=1 Tax=Vagococcus allomyrinae TaxID=2794353 RepID=A0A940P731_9ENTE|nr:hypothetical protein [Vagococcus allomyrinae]MBP1042859.1 hypothetical protein [Vagococcus allomyrinae]
MTTSLNMIQNQLVSISDLKKAPMTFVEKAQKSKDAVYIDVAVLLDTDTYSAFLHQYQELIEEITRLNEKLTYITAEQ